MLREFSVEVIHPTQDGDTIYSLLSNRAMRDPQGLVAQWQDDDTRQWHDVTATEMLSKVRAAAKGLIALGVQHGSKVVIYSATCYEWGVVDLHALALVQSAFLFTKRILLYKLPTLSTKLSRLLLLLVTILMPNA